MDCEDCIFYLEFGECVFVCLRDNVVFDEVMCDDK